MRGITTAVFFTVCITLACGAPKTNPKPNLNKVSSATEVDEGSSLIYPSDRTRPASSRRSSGATTAAGGPYLYFREPKALGREAGAWSGKWPKWGSDGTTSGARDTGASAWSGTGSSWVRQGAIGGTGGGGVSGGGVSSTRPQWYRNRGRDDEESDEEEEDADDEAEDDVGADDSGSEEEDDVAFDTPSWDSIYPPEETGGYARQNEPSTAWPQQNQQKPGQHQQIVSDGSYTLSAGSPGSPGSSAGYQQGRSGFNGQSPPQWWTKAQWSKKNWGPSSPRRREVRRGPPPTPEWVGRSQKKQWQPQLWEGDDETEGPTQWYGQRSQGQGQRWTNAGTKVYYQQQPHPQYVRRSWNWRPSTAQAGHRVVVNRPEIDSSEEVSGEEMSGQQVWSGGPRRIVNKNWARTRPSTWSGPRQSQKFGYY